MMNKKSLCLVYPNQKVINGVRQRSIYRIADYDADYDQLFPVDFFSSSYETEYEPKFLYYPQDYKPELYSVIFRRWEIDYSSEKPRTRSYSCSGNIYEVSFELEKYNGDIAAIKEAFSNGLELHEGISDNILFSLSHDENYYWVLSCSKRLFKNIDGKYYLNTQLSDLLHSTHYLDEYHIDSKEFFDIESYNYIHEYSEHPQRTRVFYSFDYLPKAEDHFFLYDIEDYIPYYISRYIRTKLKKDFSKADIQRIEQAIKVAFKDEHELKAFFDQTGYKIDAVLDVLPMFEQVIVRSISGSDYINELIDKQLQADEELRSRYYEIAFSNWKSENNTERDKLEEDIQELEQDRSSIEKSVGELETKQRQLLTLNADLEYQSDRIISELNETINNFSNELSSAIKNSLIFKNIFPASNCNPVEEGNVLVRQSDVSEDNIRLNVDSIDTRIRILNKNLTNIGMASIYSSFFAKALAGFKNLINAIIINGFYARQFSNAIAASIDGDTATIISTNSSNIKYLELANSVASINSRVILIEDLIDSCNESALIRLVKDYPDKIFIFSYENENALSIISKGLWNYAYFIDADFAFERFFAANAFILSEDSESVEPFECSTKYVDVCSFEKQLNTLGLNNVAKMKLYNVYCSLEESFGVSDQILNEYKTYIHSSICKLHLIYSGTSNKEELSDKLLGMPEEIREHYFED